MTIFGWDASDFDWARGPMDLDAAARAGIKFFTHKATEGTRTKHIHYGEALGRALNAGIPFLGPYMVPRTPGSYGNGTVTAQVQFFLDYVNQQTPWWKDFPGWFFQMDTEHWSNSQGVVYDAVPPWVGVEAANRIQDATGKKVLHYAPKWAYGDGVGGDQPLWASAYVGGGDFRAIYPGDDWKGWNAYSGRKPSILQYSSTAVIGRQSTADANAFLGTETDFARMIGVKEKIVALMEDGDFNWLSHRLHSMAHMEEAISDGLGKGDPIEMVKVLKRIDANTEATATAVGPTQEQVDAAVLKAMQDPAVQKGIGDAIASHLHVN